MVDIAAWSRRWRNCHTLLASVPENSNCSTAHQMRPPSAVFPTRTSILECTADMERFTAKEFISRRPPSTVTTTRSLVRRRAVEGSCSWRASSSESRHLGRRSCSDLLRWIHHVRMDLCTTAASTTLQNQTSLSSSTTTSATQSSSLSMRTGGWWFRWAGAAVRCLWEHHKVQLRLLQPLCMHVVPLVQVCLLANPPHLCLSHLPLRLRPLSYVLSPHNPHSQPRRVVLWCNVNNNNNVRETFAVALFTK